MNIKKAKGDRSCFDLHSQYPTTMTSQKSFKLNTGAQIPASGLGTWQDENAQEAAVLVALKAGYHHIDTGTARW